MAKATNTPTTKPFINVGLPGGPSTYFDTTLKKGFRGQNSFPDRRRNNVPRFPGRWVAFIDLAGTCLPPEMTALYRRLTNAPTVDLHLVA